MTDFEDRRKAKELDKAIDTQVDIANKMMDEFRDIIFKYDGSTPVLLVVGILEALKSEILLNSSEPFDLDFEE